MIEPADIAILIFGGLIPVGVVVTIFYLISVRRIEHRLETKHPERFLALGEPHMFFNINNVFRNNLRFASYLLSRDYIGSTDDQLVRLCQRCRKYFIVAASVFAVELVSLFAAVALGRNGT